MARISRRQFCQFTGSALATLGLSQLNIQRQAERYGKVLAQSTPRKIALLVGINQYSVRPLRGCVTDVELQRHLLIHRFGFNPKDIYTLIDEKATRQEILEKFEEHLIKQVKPGDVVVYHFSGHGSRIFDPDPIVVTSRSDNSGLNGTFVPADGNLPVGYPQEGDTVNDIMGHTLFLLMSAVKSENLTVVLDSCFSGGATRKGRVRARDGGKKVLISPEEKAYQEKWLSQLDFSREDFIQGYRTGVANGVVLAATAPNQYAADERFNNFYAGIFTYLLTQYLWQQTGTPESTMNNVIQAIAQDYYQVPHYEVKVGSGNERKPIYFINSPSPAGDAVVTEVKGNQAKFWLGGVKPEQMRMIQNSAEFTIIDAKGESSGRVTMASRNGLIGIGTVKGVVKAGTLLKMEELFPEGI